MRDFLQRIAELHDMDIFAGGRRGLGRAFDSRLGRGDSILFGVDCRDIQLRNRQYLPRIDHPGWEVVQPLQINEAYAISLRDFPQRIAELHDMDVFPGGWRRFGRAFGSRLGRGAPILFGVVCRDIKRRRPSTSGNTQFLSWTYQPRIQAICRLEIIQSNAVGFGDFTHGIAGLHDVDERLRRRRNLAAFPSGYRERQAVAGIDQAVVVVIEGLEFKQAHAVGGGDAAKRFPRLYHMKAQRSDRSDRMVDV